MTFFTVPDETPFCARAKDRKHRFIVAERDEDGFLMMKCRFCSVLMDWVVQ